MQVMQAAPRAAPLRHEDDKANMASAAPMTLGAAAEGAAAAADALNRLDMVRGHDSFWLKPLPILCQGESVLMVLG